MIPDGFLRYILCRCSPAGKKARLSVFIFHRVLPRPDPLFPDEPDAESFDRLVSWISAWFNVMPLDKAVDALARGTLPARAAVISFDDGYADNCTVAMPILIKYGVSGCFFIATGYLDGGRMWNDTIIESVRQYYGSELDFSALGLDNYPTADNTQKRRTIGELINRAKYLEPGAREAMTNQIANLAQADPPNNLMMTSAQVRLMRQSGMLIGAHTVTHPILARTDLASARCEIQESKRHLEELLAEPVTLFAYPNGKPIADYSAEHCNLIREAGFKAAVSTAWGSADLTTDLYQIPRYTPWQKTRTKFAMQLIRNLLASGTKTGTQQ